MLVLHLASQPTMSSVTNSSVRASYPRQTVRRAQVANSARWLSTSVGRQSSATSRMAQSHIGSQPSTSSSPSLYSEPLVARSSSSHALKDTSRLSSTETASVDPACATLSPSSPASPKSQKDPRVTSAITSQSPATPVPNASGPDLTSKLSPSKAAELAKDPKVAATMPEASSLAPSTSSKKASADRGTKFRSRTAALKLTPTAVLRLRALMESDSGPKLIRVGVRNKGCAGMSYHLEYIRPEEAGRFDERVKQDGVEVLIDSKALFSIIGSEMDWQEDRLSAKFVFNNPNVKEACGCGESFLT